MIVVEAVTTLTAVITAAVAWVCGLAAVGAFVACVVVFAGCATGTLGTRGPRRGLDAPMTAEQPKPAPESTPTPERRSQRHTPAWAHTDHHNHQDAA